ncbi:MAG: class I SAM-dependent methyltransferase [Planctomycetes bacterium]|nr:class I SAM-dependent methyltransferase [Planctomycetota bacterium]
MSALDTPVYHSWLEELKPKRHDHLIVDAGAGDGRNVELWLALGYRRVVAADAVGASLMRLRARIAARRPEWLGNLLLIECDVRQLPLVSGCAELLTAIEVLCYLNEDYDCGLRECARLLSAGGRIVLSERAWEGALLSSLLYGGVGQMLETYRTKYMWDGYEGNEIRSRTFGEEELVDRLCGAGLTPVARKGLSLLALVCGHLHGRSELRGTDEVDVGEMGALLEHLGVSGSMRRTHFIVARRTCRGQT